MVPNINPIIDVVIPAYNEEDSIQKVLNDIPKALVRNIWVCDNNSTDNTGQIAKDAGAKVILAPRKGYGSACLAGLAAISKADVSPDIIVFLDGDYSDHPEEMPELVKPIIEHNIDLVIGSRARGNMEPGAMMPQQIFGNWLATNMIKLIYNYEFTDLGPFRAISYAALQNMKMEDTDFGWTVEMQVKAAKHKMNCIEVPVSYRKRIGVSKVSGTVKGTFMAGYKILWTIFKLI